MSYENITVIYIYILFYYPINIFIYKYTPCICINVYTIDTSKCNIKLNTEFEPFAIAIQQTSALLVSCVYVCACVRVCVGACLH